MHRIYQNAFLLLLFALTNTLAQAQTDTSQRHAFEEMYNTRYAKPYIIAGINVTGTKAFDPNLIISISGLA